MFSLSVIVPDDIDEPDDEIIKQKFKSKTPHVLKSHKKHSIFRKLLSYFKKKLNKAL